ncbi:hypothetical protein CYMTET_12850 [Cymbomonas tetramitiformis]|uniref:Uncharacterized protein n=1 Tax=Cymbomonas tetramitiformis TaxID=36881 RepID=A0AAE0LBS4_9CHLO|nr:hypothetical protein CYMTET_12850 [Cymbomonas tetramitiformis]|eukprot:gene1675-2327_t
MAGNLGDEQREADRAAARERFLRQLRDDSEYRGHPYGGRRADGSIMLLDLRKAIRANDDIPTFRPDEDPEAAEYSDVTPATQWDSEEDDKTDSEEDSEDVAPKRGKLKD